MSLPFTVTVGSESRHFTTDDIISWTIQPDDSITFDVRIDGALATIKTSQLTHEVRDFVENHLSLEDMMYV